MVSAELIHNPYLLETSARFNGRAPKVNSAIEKFEGRPLVEWVDEVPNTFRDEMNGLDFDFSFTGTDADYDKVVKAFLDQGIDAADVSSDTNGDSLNKSSGSYEVRLIHGAALESVDTKRHEIEDLLAWLKDHENRWFDYNLFMGANSESLDGSVPYIIVNEHPIQLELPSVSVETVDSARQNLASTELTNTPILFMVNPRNSAQVRNDLHYVLGRPDIVQGQLFFCIHPSMNRERVVRVISDLGVEDPQVVDKPDDPMVIQYLDDYPSMRYVRRSVEVFRNAANEIDSFLEEVSAESAVTSASRTEQIAKLDKGIRSLRKASLRISGFKPFLGEVRIADYCQQFKDRVRTWRNKKTGVTGQDQIWRAAGDFDFDLRGWISMAEEGIRQALESEQKQMEDKLASIYKDVETTSGFTPSVERAGFRGVVLIPNVIDALIHQTETERVNPKNDFFNLFGGSSSSDDDAEYVEVASYDAWRTTVIDMLVPAIQRTASIWQKELSDYHIALVEAYTQQLTALNDELVRRRESVTAMLSDEERLLEEDKSWLQEFENRLHTIERN